MSSESSSLLGSRNRGSDYESDGETPVSEGIEERVQALKAFCCFFFSS